MHKSHRRHYLAHNPHSAIKENHQQRKTLKRGTLRSVQKITKNSQNNKEVLKRKIRKVLTNFYYT